MKNQKLTATLAGIALLGTGFLTLANAQTITGTVSNHTGKNKQVFRQNLTEAQKSILEQAKTLFEAGKKDEAKALLEKNGIKTMMGGHGHGRGMDMHKIDDAIANGDYATFQNLASTTPFGKVDQTTFNLLTPQFQAKKNAETQIQTILKNAGIEFGRGEKQPPLNN